MRLIIGDKYTPVYAMPVFVAMVSIIKAISILMHS